MKKRKPRKKTISPEVAEENNIFLFRIDKEITPSRNIEKLFFQLSKDRMKLFTPERFRKNYNGDTKYSVDGISMRGYSSSITIDLNTVRSKLNKYILDYVEGDESLVNKFYEIIRCKYLIQEFLHDITVSEPNFYNAREKYKLHFYKSKTHATIDVFAGQIVFTESAKSEIGRHFVARANALNLLYQFLDVRLEQLRMFQYQQTISSISDSDKKKEAQLLEIWIALKEAGFLDHFVTDKQTAAHRKQFFESYNLIDRNFNSNHRNFQRNKTTKGEFLKALLKIILPDPPARKKKL